MTMRRIEIWVDSDFFDDQHFENARLLLEQEVWKWAKPRLVGRGLMVQANEVPAPIPSSGSREDYERYRRVDR